MRSGIIIAIAVLCLIATACGERKMTGLPANAIILGETTVEEVNGLRVGSGNYFERRDSSGVKRRSIQVAIWNPDEGEGAEVESLVVYEGDEFAIGGGTYRLLRVETGRGGENGKAWIVPVDGPVKK